MNIIVGATGQVGSMVLSEIQKKGFPVRAVVRNPEKITDKTVDVKTADLFNADQLTEAFKGGTSVFVLTPEYFSSNDIIGETKLIVENYRKAIQATGITRIVGLSSIGAHVNSNTGNLLMSKILEQELDTIDAQKLFIRPSYYYSNWLGYLETVKEYGVLPTFFPEHLKIDMNSPVDVAKFIAKMIVDFPSSENKKVFELLGPRNYSSHEVAKTFEKLFNKEVNTQSIPRDQWKDTLLSVGFTENTAHNLMDMTQAVIDSKTVPEYPNHTIKLSTTIEQYFEEQLR